MPKFKTWLVLVLGLAFMVVSCSAAENAIKQLKGEYNKYAKQFSNATKNAAATAKDPKTQSPAASGSAPALPKDATGGTDLGKSSEGKTGTETLDIDEDGVNEEVTVFIDAEGVTYVSWKGDKDSDDDGVCYLAWEKPAGTVWVVASACDNPETGAIVCQVEGEDVTCSYCEANGQCKKCDIEKAPEDCSPSSSGESSTDGDATADGDTSKNESSVDATDTAKEGAEGSVDAAWCREKCAFVVECVADLTTEQCVGFCTTSSTATINCVKEAGTSCTAVQACLADV